MNEKVLCIDYGLRRIGLAISDDTATIAFPYKYLPNTGMQSIFEELNAIISKENIGVIIIGMPIGLRGQPTALSIKVNEFTSELNSAIKNGAVKDTVVITFDERFSTSQAQKSLIKNNIKRKKRKEIIDSVAASLILQSYLNSKN